MSKKITLKLIDEPSNKLRESIDSVGLQELAQSIQEVGLINPITVKRKGDRFEIITGNRRFLAHKIANLKTIDANIVKGSEENNESAKMAENLMREDLNPIEQANEILHMQTVLNMGAEKIGRKLGKTRRWVELKIELLKLPSELVDGLRQGLLNEKVARELAQIDEELERKRLTTYAIAHGATWKVVNDWVTNWKINKGFEAQIKNKELSQGEVEGTREVRVKCILCGEQGNIEMMRYEPCHRECFFELMVEIQKRERQQIKEG